MMRCKGPLRILVALLVAAIASLAHAQSDRPPGPEKVNTIREVFEKLFSCWKPPPVATVNPMDITVVVSFNRAGQILGHPRITYESEQATDNDRLKYRVAVMETLQRCTPLPFTEGLGGAVAGRPLAVRFTTRKRPPKTEERRAWLPQKIL